MRIVILVGFLGLLSACVGSRKLPVALRIDRAEIIFIDSLKCLKLSEKLVGFGSVNDEIMLAVFYVNINGKHRLIWNSAFLEVGEEGEKIGIGEQLLLGNTEKGGSLKLVLLEQDTERSEVELVNLLGEIMDENKTVDELRKGMRDDDLLGVHSLGIENVAAAGELRFWGMQLFDEFEYILEYRFVPVVNRLSQRNGNTFTPPHQTSHPPSPLPQHHSSK